MIGTLPKITEADVIAQSLAFLRLHGVTMERRNTGGFTNPHGQYVQCSEPGAADYHGTLPGGRRFELELKAPDWKPGGNRERERFARQISYLNRVNSDGGVGLLIDHVEALIKVWPYITPGAGVLVLPDGRLEITPCLTT